MAQLTVTWDVINTGNGQSGPCSQRVVLHNHTTGTTVIDEYIYSYRNIGANERLQRSYSVFLPYENSPAGDLELTVELDPHYWGDYGYIYEYSDNGTAENNNIASTRCTIGQLQTPDIQPLNLTMSPSEPKSGNQVSLSWDDMNTGGQAAIMDWSDRIVVTNKTTGNILVSDCLYHSATTEGAVAAGTSLRRNYSFTLPKGMEGAGDLICELEVDCFNYQYEYNSAGTGEANNNATIATTASLAPYPDLQTQNLTITPSTFQSGDQITITWDDANIGNGATTSSWSDHLVVLNTTTGSTLLDRYVLHNKDIDGIVNPGNSIARSHTFTLPDGNSGAGNLAINLNVDHWNAQYEYNASGTAETNNSSTITTSAALAPYADLQIQYLALTPEDPVSGSNLTLTWDDVNSGNCDATGTWYDNIVVTNTTTGSVLVNTHLYHYANSEGVVASGTRLTRSYSFELPDGDTGVGELLATVTTDKGSQLYEYNASGTGETNNTATVTATSSIALYPDLQVHNLTITPLNPVSGGQVIIAWDDLNTGNGDAASTWYDSIVVTNTTTGSVLINTNLYHNANSENTVAAGARLARSYSFTLPDGIAGVGALLATVTTDKGSQLYEYNASGTGETNNTATVTATSSIALYPDLQVHNLTITPLNPVSGGQVTIAWDDVNTGSGDAMGTWYDHIVVTNTSTGGTVLDTYVSGNNGTTSAAGSSTTRSHSFTLPDGDAGVGGLLTTVSTDCGSYSWGWNSVSRLFEYNSAGTAESNNTATATVIATLAQYPDLQVQNLIFSPANPVSGGQVTILWDDVNTGSGNATGTWYDHVVVTNISTGSTVLDAYVEANRAGHLAAGSSIACSRSFTLPDGDAGVGNLLATVTTDIGIYSYFSGWAGSRIFEYNSAGTAESNNTSSATTTASLARYPDLQVQNLTFTPENMVSGGLVTITWDDINTGNGAATATWFDQIVVANTTTGATLLTAYAYADTHGMIAAGSSQRCSYSFALPDGEAGVGDLTATVATDAGHYHWGWSPGSREYEYNTDGTAESNNSAVVTTRSTLAPYPDLQVRNLVASPSALLSGDQLMITWEDENTGNRAVTVAWNDRLVVVNTTTGNTVLDTMVQANSGGYLPAGSSLALSYSFKMPDGNTGAGDFLVTVAADSGYDDPGSVIYEHNMTGTAEANNDASTYISATLKPYPDLVVTDFVVPSEILTGQPVQLSWSIQNQDIGTASGTWVDNVYLSDDASPGEGNLFASFSFTGELAHGESITRTQSIILPSTYVGQHWFVVKSNANSQIYENGTVSNNFAVGSLPTEVMLSPYPNLVVSQVSVPATPYSGQIMEVAWTVTNTGDGPTTVPTWYDSVFLSHDSILDWSDILLGKAANPSYLGPNESYGNSLNAFLPQGIDGTYYFLVQSDCYNNVYEYLHEDDNGSSTDAGHIQLTSPPDLIVSQVIAPSMGFSGNSATVTWTVSNEGSGRTVENTWTDRIYLSLNTAVDAGDHLLGQVYHSGTLNPDDSYTVSQSVNLPIGVSGDHNILVWSDAHNTVFENGVDNNNVGISPRTTHINLTPPPDLEVESVAVPDAAIAGQKLSVAYRVNNVGSTTTPNSLWSDAFYLSDDTTLDPNDLALGEVAHYGALNVGDFYEQTATVTLPQALAGNYHILVSADMRNDVFELDDDNNIWSSAQPLVVATRPADLIVSEVTCTDAVIAGHQLSVAWTVVNRGMGGTLAGNWIDKIIVSPDNIAGNADDIELARFQHSGELFSGATYSSVKTVDIPHEFSGTHSLFVVTDSEQQVQEADAEHNNASASHELVIDRRLTDLQVISATASTSGLAGCEITIDWSVRNSGIDTTNANYWYDTVYLSSTAAVIPGNSLVLGGLRHVNPLNGEQHYAATATFTLPATLSAGNYYVIVRTDTTDSVSETGSASNNDRLVDSLTVNGELRGSVLHITSDLSSHRPDLVLVDVNAPSQTFSGQTFDVSWTVRNDGDDVSASWFDTVYLSRDQIFDPSDDIYLGYLFHGLQGSLVTGSLMHDQSYDASTRFTVPHGHAGPFYVFVSADGANSVRHEASEANNVGYDHGSMQVSLAPPADLIVGDVTLPANLVSGQTASFTYTIANQGNNAASGSWYDSLYLSTDTTWDIGDTFIGRALHSGVLAAGSSYSTTLTTALPGVAPGDYHLIVRSDIRNNILESDEANNIGGSLDQSSLDVEQLAAGSSASGHLERDQVAYYRIDVGAEETLRLSLWAASSDDIAGGEIYVQYGTIPTRSAHDLAATEPFKANQTLIVPQTRAGTYYVMIYDPIGTVGAYTLTAETPTFSIARLETTSGSNRGQVTIGIEGAKITEATKAFLVGTTGVELESLAVYWKDNAHLWATFDLRGQEQGHYAITIRDGEQVYTLDGAFTVNDGAEGKIEYALLTSSTIRSNGMGDTLRITYWNSGDTDLVAPLFTLSGNALFKRPDEAAFTGQAFQFLGINESGPAGTLAPGAKGSVTLRYIPDFNGGGTVTLNLATVLEDLPIAWQAYLDGIMPEGVDPESWAQVEANLIQILGTTTTEYQATLARNATALGMLGIHTNDVGRLFALSYQRASNNGDLLRYAKVGPLGRDRAFEWDNAMAWRPNGDILVTIAGVDQLFTRLANGSYKGPGDATLQETAGTFAWRKPDGSEVVFSPDGTFTIRREADGTLWSADYAAGRLGQVTASNGNSRVFTYNEAGRLVQIVDQDGNVRSFTYDNSGEYLTSFTSEEGTTSYEYVTEPGAAQHRLRKMTLPDGTAREYGYDPQGRMSNIRLNGIASISYQYPDVNETVATYSGGLSIATWKDDMGRVLRVDEVNDITVEMLANVMTAGGSNTQIAQTTQPSSSTAQQPAPTPDKQVIIKKFTYGYTWNGTNNYGNPLDIQYAFLNSVPSYYQPNVGFYPTQDTNDPLKLKFTPGQKKAVEDIFGAWSAVANIVTMEINNPTEPQLQQDKVITFGNANLGNRKSDGIVAGSTCLPYLNPSADAGDVWINSNPDIWLENKDPSSSRGGYNTLLHEIGHAIGLIHPNDDPNTENIFLTAMSYVAYPAFKDWKPDHPQLYDITAIQYLYGPKITESDGSLDDVYRNSSTDPSNPDIKAVWDPVGIDELSASNQSTDCHIDLRPGSFSGIGTLNGIHNIALAYDQTVNGASYGWIENGTGGKGNDVIIGNIKSNILQGGAGSDELQGGAGSDELQGGDGNDILYGAWASLWNRFKMFLGGAGHGITFDGDGPDKLYGGNGIDTYYVENGDYIEDIDETGHVCFEGIWLSGGTREAGETAFTGLYGEKYRELTDGTVLVYAPNGHELTIKGTGAISSHEDYGAAKISGLRGMGITLNTLDLNALPPDIPGKKPPGPNTTGPNTPGQTTTITVLRASDPNDIVGPQGYGDENWVSAAVALPYTIRFENEPDATAPAQEIHITQQLDADLDWRSFRLGDFALGDQLFTTANDRAYYSDRLDLTATIGCHVDVAATIDVRTGVASWDFVSIDPATGELPSDPTVGLLPVNDASHRGEGFVSYTIQPKRGIATGSVVNAQAVIIFDINEPIATPSIFATLDTVAPSSQVDMLPASLMPASGSDVECLVSWSGTDDETGSAIRDYSIYVSVDGGSYHAWYLDTTATDALYTGAAGHSYAFYSTARDYAGNVEAPPAASDALLTVLGNSGYLSGFVFDDLAGDGVLNGADAGLAGWTVFLDADADGVLDAGETSVTTVAGGSYNFANVGPGSHRVGIFDPGGWGYSTARFFDVVMSSGGTASYDFGVNQTPTANGDSFDGVEDQTLSGNVAGNDSDSDGPAYLAQLLGDVSHGLLSFNADGSFSYTPEANWSGTESFTYRVGDGISSGNTATVSLVIAAANDAPTAENDSYDVLENHSLTVAASGVLGNDHDLDSGSLSALWVSGPTHGVLVFNANGNFSYTPTTDYIGPDSFSYRASDGTSPGNIATVSLNVTPDTLKVTGLAVNASGFHLDFNRAVQIAPLNLGNAADHPQGAADLVLTRLGAPSFIRGSLVLDADLTGATFVKSFGVLDAGSYTLTLASRADAWIDSAGRLLDGNGNGVAGDNYMASFSVAASTSAILGVSEVLAGPGLALTGYAPTNQYPVAGLPISLSGAAGVTTLAFDLAYDPALLNLTSVGFITGATGTSYSFTSPGVVHVQLTTPNLTSASADIVRLYGSVPATEYARSHYGAKQVLDLHNVTASRALRVDDGLLVNAYSGDTSGNAAYDTLDTTRMQSVIVGGDTGFSAYPLLDTSIVGDVNRDKLFGSVDKLMLGYEIEWIVTGNATKNRKEIDPLPTGLGPITFTGADPLIDLPRDLVANVGDIITVPVRLDIADNLEQVQLQLCWDAGQLELLDVRRGSLTGGFDNYVENRQAGSLYVDMSTMNRLAGGAGSVLELSYRVMDSGEIDLDLEWAALNQTRLTLNPSPHPGADPTDGRIVATATRTPPLPTADLGFALSPPHDARKGEAPVIDFSRRYESFNFQTSNPAWLTGWLSDARPKKPNLEALRITPKLYAKPAGMRV